VGIFGSSSDSFHRSIAVIDRHMPSMGRTIKLAAFAVIVVAACYVLPQGKRAVELHAAADDPAKLADLQLVEVFDQGFAAREIERALDTGDVELAESFAALADERGIPVSDELKTRLVSAQTAAAKTSRVAGSFGRGFVTGQTDDVAGLAGAATGDLIGWGDVRDLARESWHAMTGQEVNKLLVGMSAVGLAVTAWTYMSIGAAAPVREGLSVAKVASRTERMGKGLAESVGRSFVNGRSERIGVAIADLGTMQSKAGTRATLQGLREAESVSEISKLKRLATAKGRTTLAVLKTLGRNAFVLGAVAVTAAGWIFGALINLLLLIVAIQKGFIALIRKLWPRRSWRMTDYAAGNVAVTQAND
jgi:hypothetical protein